MSNAQNGLPASDAVPVSADSAPEGASGLGAGADGEAGGEFGIEDGADLGGHTRLSRPAAPQGRRSLFRR